MSDASQMPPSVTPAFLYMYPGRKISRNTFSAADTMPWVLSVACSSTVSPRGKNCGRSSRKRLVYRNTSTLEAADPSLRSSCAHAPAKSETVLASSSGSEVMDANEREVQMLSRRSLRSSCSAGVPWSSVHVRSPFAPKRDSAHARGLPQKSSAVSMPQECMVAESLRPMPQTSSMGVSDRALTLFSSVSMVHTPPYPLWRLAKWLAIFESVFVGDRPMLTGMPVHFSTFSLSALQASSRAVASPSSRRRKASSMEYTSMP